MSYHALLRYLYEPKMDVILTISFKITAEIEITKHMFCVLLCRRGRISAFCNAKLCSFIHSLPWNAFTLFCFFLLLIARLMRVESYSVAFLFFLLSFFFVVVVFYTYISLRNCYLIKCNKQQEKYLVSREKIVHRILKLISG